ncbi:MAG: sigma-70 family RNA polymerase sigma factor [Pseudolabrys sp.]|nr:sigma-70 family RNA polymerase sigma factor [Pseudolabrys sp.]
MSTERHRRSPPLTLIPGASADGVRRAAGGYDWSTLMARAQEGDRKAYRTLLEDLAPYIRSIAQRCFKQPSDIEDAVQDVLLTVHMVRHAYDPSRPFGPWFLAIANRRIIDRLRRETRRKAREIELSPQHETFNEHATNLDEALYDEASLNEAIERLPPDQRQAIKMLKLNEMSLKDAAAASGRSIAALKVATHRAVKSLRKMLQAKSE